MTLSTVTRLCLGAGLALGPVAATAAPVVLVKLTGTTGAAPAANTAVYRADLGSLTGNFSAIQIKDASGNFGGSGGQFSGFDLDAIKISATMCTTAACAASATGLSLFDFVSGIVFTPGTQRAPADPKLYGTGPNGNTIDNAVARLGLFDGVADTASPSGFASLGDGGAIAFNLNSSISGQGLYLYLGEVGDNGEVAGSNIDVLSGPVSGVPETATWGMMMLGFGTMGYVMRRPRPRRTTARIRFA